MSEFHEDRPLLTSSDSDNISIDSENDIIEDHHIANNPHISPINDFDQADSWGMLHEVNDSPSNKMSIDKHDVLVDHRPTLNNMLLNKSNSASAGRPRPRANSNSIPYRKKVSSNSTEKSYHAKDFYDKTRSSNFSSSQLDQTQSNMEHMHKVNEERIRRRKTIANGDVVIDVDALMKSVHKDNESLKNGLGLSRHSTSLAHSNATSNEEELNSRPSSRRSSNDSSLDDVCLFLDDVNSLSQKVWPDVEVLEEFSKEETEKLRRQAIEDAEEFHFNYDEEDEGDEDSASEGIFFSKPIVTSIDVPELGNRKVNEAEDLKEGRLRPKRITPWHLRKAALQNQTRKSSLRDEGPSNGRNEVRDNFLVGRNIQYPPHIISSNPEHFRFTYFRVDLESTVHSPTISGLLQTGQKFEDLFVSSVYSNENNRADGSSLTPIGSKSMLSTQSQNQLHNQAGNNNISQSQMYKTNSRISNPIAEYADVSPFWLDVLNPTEEEMKVLSKAFGIHPLTTEDIFLGEAREKVELFKDYYLVCFRSFDIVAERTTRRKKEKSQELSTSTILENENLYKTSTREKSGILDKIIPSFLRKRRRSSAYKTIASSSDASSYRRRKSEREKEEKERYKRKSGDRHKPREGELEPLNVYIIVFRTGVLTFHFAPTPHPINVRRRARILKDYLNVTSDWLAYALIDDITDAFAPMIELIEDEVYDIEDAILKMHHSDDSSDSDSSDSDSSDSENDFIEPLLDRRNRYGDYESIINNKQNRLALMRRKSTFSKYSSSSSSISSRSNSTGYTSLNANIIGWKKKGDMLRRIGECRKRVMSILRLLGSKADVIKGFSKRCNEQWEVAPRSEIGMFLGDIQDHIITMVSSLNHYEKLLSRSHSNYLAQINIDMTKVNNDMNDVLGKITILGTVVLPMNVITGLWGMNVLVPGQENESLVWFISIFSFMIGLAYCAFVYTRRRFGF
ncbi:hypothetical protein Kpol_262p6 [Vanderwaltozyma polyspora DSM 70294]|uniref:Manganese resistance protein MNR2 n=1 Tax=Vanderwaltozyma polyspora (strain ATCC 22028 / DSM 70294 / BCRC 21397 / CBS 2163 / NBRC 10782 / NRRL Y-8283 / UCD 57-17) TaxID=436907 RepID=A7TT10_VANPO|nr:uncharacterized protein Kpol_262p6 [Vanderwaltozyma polyspora DSM 70294]EDO14601.1 hypothetical protein Kpol_262p6 [Vanderwaltozyma polyspora DSM 70294]